MYGGHRWDHGGYEHGDHSGYGGHHWN
jgi:hypothetical protein